MRNKRELNAFIASPGDVPEERIIVRQVCDELNKKAWMSSYGISFKATGWEDVFPSPGRPQEIINKLVDECDIFVCILHKKFGTHTGKEESGTLEEFLKAYDLWKEKKKPHIMFYFKEAKISSLEELPQFQKVLELKGKIVKEKLLLYGEFTDPEDFRKKFSNNIEKWIVENFKKAELREGQEADEALVSVSEIPEVYRTWLMERCAYMDIEKLAERGEVITVRLPEIFIPLYAYEPAVKSSDKLDLREKEKPEDIEELISKNEYLLIEGHPGSGKTTLLKHLAYSLAKENNYKGMHRFLPILIFLKDLKGFFEKHPINTASAQTAEDILSYHLESIGTDLSIKIVKAFRREQKTLFLLDGLDEIYPQQRDVVVNSFADFGINYKGNKVVFSSRPHGLEGAVINRLGNKHIAISLLNMGQVKVFIKKWFQFVYSASSQIGKKTAVDMMSEIKDHPVIGQLINNPLMLTAVCILYHDGKELPGQRAELYKKFVNNLLYRRFSDPERIHAFLKLLAFKMHSKRDKGVDRAFAIAMLKQIYKKDDKETKEEYRDRIEKLFGDIEPKCGLLKFEQGQYTFWHLTFQEFLTAVWIVDNSTDYAEAIGTYWDNDWYMEVIELYIGYLSIENKRWANQVVKNVVDIGDTPPFKKWLLASKSLIDIHEDRREPEVLEKAQNRLLQIMDSDAKPKIRAEAGEILGWLGDPRDLKEFILVAGGEYKLSKAKITIEPLEIGKYPVTNNWFEAFIKAGGYKNIGFWGVEGKKWLDHTKAEQPEYWNERKWKCPNAPVVGVSWYEADAFCRWLTLELKDGYEYRLPDENEWEAAASGTEGRKYPWGNKWDKNTCNNVETDINKTSSVGVFKKGNTSSGIVDLSGSVWVWTMSNYHSRKKLHDFRFVEYIQKLFKMQDRDKKEYFSELIKKDIELPVLRGGSWSNAGCYFCKCYVRNREFPGVRYNGIGFRCARTPRKY